MFYQVQVIRNVQETVTVTVEATDDDEAKEQARLAARQEHPDAWVSIGPALQSYKILAVM